MESWDGGKGRRMGGKMGEKGLALLPKSV